jgi:hypothetical protein
MFGFSIAQIIPERTRHRDLQAGGVVVRAELARLVDRQLRAVPVRILLVAGEQHAELVDTRGDLVHEDALAILQVPVAAGELVHRDHRRVARVIGVVRGRPVDHLGALPHRQVVGDGNRLGVCDQETVEVPAFGVQVRTRVAAPGCIR